MSKELNILLIDDEVNAIPRLVNNLKKKHKVTTAATVVSALNHLNNSLIIFDYIILDIMLPFPENYTASETDSGKKTGYIFYKKELEKEKFRKKIIVW